MAWKSLKVVALKKIVKLLWRTLGGRSQRISEIEALIALSILHRARILRAFFILLQLQDKTRKGRAL